MTPQETEGLIPYRQRYVKELIGGRTIDDIEQIVRSLYAMTKEAFPINGVPEDLHLRMESLLTRAKGLREQVEEYRALLNVAVGPQALE